MPGDYLPFTVVLRVTVLISLFVIIMEFPTLPQERDLLPMMGTIFELVVIAKACIALKTHGEYQEIKLMVTGFFLSPFFHYR